MPQMLDPCQPLLTMDGLACRRGTRLLWRGLSAELACGQALHITGANGTGKSSLIRMLAGLLPPMAGTCAVRGDAAMIDEAHALDADRPLAHALSFWAGLAGAPAGAVEDALARIGIAHLADVPVRILSTGQRKRAGLARLLLSDAALWLMDEPANGLDSAGVALLEALVAAHLAAGGGAVIASHLPLAIAPMRRIAIQDFAP